jgi:hypothetical protein
MPVYSCPHCAKRLRTEAELTRRVNCPHCGQPIDPAPPLYARPALPPQQPPPEPAGPGTVGVLAAIGWILAAAWALLHLLLLSVNIHTAQSAMQEAAAGAMACGYIMAGFVVAFAFDAALRRLSGR